MVKTECPTGHTLRQYVLGDCSDAISDDLERHLADCPTCEATIAEFDTVDDTLLRHLPLVAVVSQNTSVPPGGWIDMLRRAAPTNKHDDTPEGTVGTKSSLAQTEPAILLTEGIANYEILGELGRGGMGIVFLARHKQLHRRVALKVVRPEALSSLVARRRFQREIQILGGLHHPGIVMATDAGIVGRGAYLVMEWIDGVDFGRLVRMGGPLTIETACEAGRQIAEALAAAHKSGVVHRDVKPSNTMVDTAGRVRLLDFGLAHMTKVVQDSADTSIGRLLGTLDYMAPEQAAGDGQIDARADLYGLGAMLFFLLTGQPPHGSRTNRPVLEQIRIISQDESPQVSTIRVDVPADLDRLIARLLCRDAAMRPDSASEIAAVLGRWAGGDLATRVIEFQTQLSTPNSEAADCAAAQQSLAELLGDDLSVPNSSPVVATAPDRRRFHRLWWSLVALLAVISFPAVILWVQTSNGTLKIESDAGDVALQLVDDQDRSRELIIKEGKNETVLRTGQYRIRLTGEHDGLELDRDTITLRRGADVVTRITRQIRNEPQPAPSEKTPIAERLYQGRSESDWKRQFQLETEPLAKLDAANAMLSLGSVLPPTERLERLLDIGEEIVRVSADDPLVEVAFQFGFSTPFPGKIVWGQPGSHGHSSLIGYQNNLNSLSTKMSAPDRSKGFSRAMVDGSDARAAFASAMFRQYASTAKNDNDPVAVHTVLTSLDVPLQGFDRSALCQLARMRYISFVKDATDAQRTSVLTSWRQLAARVIEFPMKEPQKRTLRDRIRNDLLMVAKSLYRLDSSSEFREVAARLVLSELLEQPNPAFRRFLYEVHPGAGGGGMGGMFGGGGFPQPQPQPDWTYNPERTASIRQSTEFFLGAWVKIANEYLEQNSKAPTEQGVQHVIRTLDAALALFSDEDIWPVKRTAELLADFLPAYEAEGQDGIIKQSAAGHPPVTPAMLLTQIVRITGRVPDTVRTEKSESQQTVKNLRQLEFLLNKNNQTARDAFHEFGKDLLTTAPADVLRIICGVEVSTNEDENFTFRGRNWVRSKLGIFSALAEACGPPNSSQTTFSPVDPLLLLVTLTELTGQDAKQDAGIASLFEYQNLDSTYRNVLKNLLVSSLRFRRVARESLQRMAADSKDESLKVTIRNLIAETEESAVPK